MEAQAEAKCSTYSFAELEPSDLEMSVRNCEGSSVLITVEGTEEPRSSVGPAVSGSASLLEDFSSFAAAAETLPATSPAPRSAPARNRITCISEETAAAISSQQVVIDLKSICKELVENALDAGSTAIGKRALYCVDVNGQCHMICGRNGTWHVARGST